MAVEYDSNGIPILSGESMLSDVPQYTQELAPKLTELDDKIDSAGGPTIAGPFTWSPGTFTAGTHNLTGHAFNGKVGDIWIGHFNIGLYLSSVGGGAAYADFRLRLASGIPIYNPTKGNLTCSVGNSQQFVQYVSWAWKATQANDFLIVDISTVYSSPGDAHIQAVAVNHGGGVTTTLRERAEMFKERLETPTAGTADQKE